MAPIMSAKMWAKINSIFSHTIIVYPQRFLKKRGQSAPFFQIPAKKIITLHNKSTIIYYNIISSH
jgi:hypothetical protein